MQTAEQAYQQELEHRESLEMNPLNTIQTELKAPKSQYNNFGKYKYRSCEDILTGLKPLLEKTNTSINLSDSVISVGDRIYICAEASLLDEKGKVISQSQGYAREPLSKKGMDESQITGTASSYARKYALNGLLAIDDQKDADTDESKLIEKNAPVPEEKLRISHDEMLQKTKEKMDSATSIGQLKMFYQGGVDHFRQKNAPKEYEQELTKLKDKLKPTFEQAA